MFLFTETESQSHLAEAHLDLALEGSHSLIHMVPHFGVKVITFFPLDLSYIVTITYRVANMVSQGQGLAEAVSGMCGKVYTQFRPSFSPQKGSSGE